MSTQSYRPDIDGLRAIAVISVLLYHLNEQFLSGGFVGVDVFFVISGYLITRLIYKEYSATGDFSYRNFYLRRVRRLFPALFAVLLFSLVVGAKLFSPAHLVEMAESLIAAILSLSNIYFWNTAGYFDSDSSLKPLLHTWSLSVEEQFYFIWPLVLVSLCAMGRKHAVPIFIVLMGLASLLLNVWVFAEQATIASWFGQKDNQSAFDVHSTAFYWLPFRVFEFALGAILVWTKTPDQTKSGWINEGLFLLGLAMVIYSVVAYTDAIEFPSTAALLPCVGASLMIYSGPSHRLTFLVSNRLMVGVGLISYSLYLIHWPMIVFYKYWRYVELGVVDYIVLGVSSVIVAYLMYRFIETPYRKPLPKVAGRAANKPFLLGALASALIAVGVSAHASTSQGWLWRFPSDVVAQLKYKHGDYTEFFWKAISTYDARAFADNGNKKLLVIGDSMAADFINVLAAGDQLDKLDLSALKVGNNCKGVFSLTEKQYDVFFGGAKEVCQKEHQRLISSPLLAEADTIVLATYWWERNRLAMIQPTVDYIRANTDSDVMVLGAKVQVSNGIWFLSKHSFSPSAIKAAPSVPDTGVSTAVGAWFATPAL
ncbi:MAG: acyltransferase [Pseudomonadota bacterium]